MKFISKSISFMIAISVLFSSMTFCVYANENIPESEQVYVSEYENLLNSLGIINIDENYKPDDKITKIEFIKLLLTMIKADCSVYDGDEQLFMDVPLTSENFEYASCAFKMGIINGYADGNLGTYDEITMQDAMVMTIRALGYQKLAELSGGYLSGYTEVASVLEIFDEIKCKDGKMSNANAAYMIYNALTAPVYTTLDFKSWQIAENSTLMGQLYELSYVEGVVMEDSTGSLLNSSDASNDKIKIDNHYYNIPQKYSRGFLGKRVRAYYIGNRQEEWQIVYMLLHNKNEILNLKAEDLISHAPLEIEYEKSSKNKTQTVKLSPYAITVKNGNIIKIGGNEKIVENGDYTIIDNDRDGLYDVVIIDSWRTIVVKNVSVVNRVIYDVCEAEEPIYIDDYEVCEIFDEEGNVLELQNISSKNVLSVQASENKRYIKIISISGAFEGVIGGVSKNKGRYIYRLKDGGEVLTSPEFKKYVDSTSVKSGVSYKFFLDGDGEIVYLIESGEILKYGWLKGVSMESRFENEVKAKILTTDGTFKEYRIENKISCNGSKISAESCYLKLDGKEQLVRYRATEDVIKEIETVAYSGAEKGFILQTQLPDSSGGYESRYYSDVNLIGGKIAVDGNTIVFDIPTSGKDEDYIVGTRSVLVHQSFYPLASGYKELSKEGFVSDVVVLYEGEKAFDKRILVSGLQEQYDSETDENCTVLCGYSNGSYVEHIFKDSVLPEYTTKAGAVLAIEEGDLVKIGLNAKNRIEIIKLVYDESTGNFYGTNDTNDSGVSFGAQEKVLCGTPLIAENGYMKIISDVTGAEYEYLIPVNSTTSVMQYDKTARDEDKIHKAGLDDIETLSKNPQLKDKVVIVMNYQNAIFVGVYKK